MTTTETEAPLTNYRVTGVQENWIGINPGTEAARMVPGGSCWLCGTGIAIEVVIKSTETGEVHTIGTTCAERVGLNGAELKAMLADKYATERAVRREANSKAARAARAAQEEADTAAHGTHGTTSRYLSGCNCNACVAAAPHGTTARFDFGLCRCLRCIDAVMAARPREYRIQEDRHVIVALSTGEVVPAKDVDTKFGWRWCVRDGAAWLPVSPARRSTHAKHGYVQATAPFLVEVCGQGSRQWLKPLCRLGEPLVDAWGERIERP